MAQAIPLPAPVVRRFTSRETELSVPRCPVTLFFVLWIFTPYEIIPKIRGTKRRENGGFSELVLLVVVNEILVNE